MIVHDKPRSAWRGPSGRQILTRYCQLASTLPGLEGTAELVAFGRRVGFAREQLVDPGEPTERFDVYGDDVRRVEAEGSTRLSPREFARQVRQHKRWGPPPAPPEQLVLLEASRSVLEPDEPHEAGWVATDRVLEHLGIDRRTLRAAMRDAEQALAEFAAAGIFVAGDEALHPCWVNIGTGARERWKWNLGKVDRWFAGVGAWRASRSAARTTSSAGATSTAPSADAPPPTTRPRRSSPERSSGPSLSAAVGSLRTVGRSRRSSTSESKKAK